MSDAGWASIPNWLIRDPKVKPDAKLLYVYLNSRVGRTGTCWPSLPLVAEETGLSVSTVKRAMNDLRALGVVESKVVTSARGRHNVYRLTTTTGGGWGQSDPMGEVSVTPKEESVEETPLSPPEGGVGSSDAQSTEVRPRTSYDYTDEFEREFWERWPNKSGKPAAFKAWRAALKRESKECILTGLAQHLPSVEDKRSKGFFLTASRWLNENSWNDEVTPLRHEREVRSGFTKESLGPDAWFRQQPGETLPQYQKRVSG